MKCFSSSEWQLINVSAFGMKFRSVNLCIGNFTAVVDEHACWEGDVRIYYNTMHLYLPERCIQRICSGTPVDFFNVKITKFLLRNRRSARVVSQTSLRCNSVIDKQEEFGLLANVLRMLVPA